MASFWDRPRRILSVNDHNLILNLTYHRLVFPVPGGPQRRISLFQLIVHLSSFRAEKDTMRQLHDVPNNAVSVKITHPFELWRGAVLTVEVGRTADCSYSSVCCLCYMKRKSHTTPKAHPIPCLVISVLWSFRDLPHYPLTPRRARYGGFSLDQGVCEVDRLGHLAGRFEDGMLRTQDHPRYTQ